MFGTQVCPPSPIQQSQTVSKTTRLGIDMRARVPAPSRIRPSPLIRSNVSSVNPSEIYGSILGSPKARKEARKPRTVGLVKLSRLSEISFEFIPASSALPHESQSLLPSSSPPGRSPTRKPWRYIPDDQNTCACHEKDAMSSVGLGLNTTHNCVKDITCAVAMEVEQSGEEPVSSVVPEEHRNVLSKSPPNSDTEVLVAAFNQKQSINIYPCAVMLSRIETDPNNYNQSTEAPESSSQSSVRDIENEANLKYFTTDENCLPNLPKKRKNGLRYQSDEKKQKEQKHVTLTPPNEIEKTKRRRKLPIKLKTGCSVFSDFEDDDEDYLVSNPGKLFCDPSYSRSLYPRLGRCSKLKRAAPVRANRYAVEENDQLTDEDEDMKKAIMMSKQEEAKAAAMDAEAEKLPHPTSAYPLTPEMLQQIQVCFDLPSDTKIITKFSLTIKRCHLKRFRKSEWLEDPNVDFYMEMIRERNKKMLLDGANYPRVYVFQSFLYRLFASDGYGGVQETADDNIFFYDMAFFPIVIRDHWRLIVADFRKKTLLCYDSMYRLNDRHLDVIEGYLHYEYKRQFPTYLEHSAPAEVVVEIPNTSAAMSPESEPSSGADSEATTEEMDITLSQVFHEAGDTPSSMTMEVIEAENEATEVFYGPKVPTLEEYFSNWIKDTVDPVETGLPQQKNGNDCGIFLCQYAEALARGDGPPFDFTQKNMLYFRYLMAYETINGKISDRGNPLGAPIPLI